MTSLIQVIFQIQLSLLIVLNYKDQSIYKLYLWLFGHFHPCFCMILFLFCPSLKCSWSKVSNDGITSTRESWSAYSCFQVRSEYYQWLWMVCCCCCCFFFFFFFELLLLFFVFVHLVFVLLIFKGEDRYSVVEITIFFIWCMKISSWYSSPTTVVLSLLFINYYF